jgi:hypothetical protein
MCSYKDSLILFGGAGNYFPKLKARETYDDIWQYKVNVSINMKGEWRKLMKGEFGPRER